MAISLNAATLLTALTVSATLMVPGPTNTLLFLAGAKHRVKRSLVLIGIELLGYCLAIGVWWGFLGLADFVAPAAPAVVRVCSAAYVGCLAIKMWREASVEGDRSEKLRVRALFCATLLNPKAFFLAAFVFPPASEGVEALMQTYLLFSALAIPIGAGWICLGATVVPGVNHRWQHVAQRTAAFVLFIFSVSIWVSVLR